MTCDTWKFRHPIALAALLVVLSSPITQAEEDGRAEWQELKVLADTGNAVAQYELGLAYESGIGIEHSATKALRYYYLAANQGHAAAQNEVGNSFHGQGKFEEALPWYEKSASGGDSWGIHNLAFLYDQGRGVAVDKKKAVSLYLRAANLDNADSMWKLAVLLGYTSKQPIDLYAACIWNHRAVSSFGNRQKMDDREKRVFRRAEDQLMLLRYEMTEDDMSKCKTEADSWAPTIAETDE